MRPNESISITSTGIQGGMVSDSECHIKNKHIFPFTAESAVLLALLLTVLHAATNHQIICHVNKFKAITAWINDFLLETMEVCSANASHHRRNNYFSIFSQNSGGRCAKRHIIIFANFQRNFGKRIQFSVLHQMVRTSSDRWGRQSVPSSYVS